MASTPTPVSRGSVDFGRAFQFFFQDPDWVRKALIGGGLTLLGTIGIVLLGAGLLVFAIVIGYVMRLLQQVYAGNPRPMPEWQDYGGLMREGLKGIGLWLVYFAGGALIPVMGIIVMGVASGAASSAGADAAGGLFALGIMGLQLILMLVMLVLMVYVPAAFLRMTLYQRFGAGFEFRENLELIRRNPANYAIAILIYLVANFVSQFGIILCCVGVFPASFWSYCVMGFSLGEVARNDSFLGQAVQQPAPAPTPGL